MATPHLRRGGKSKCTALSVGLCAVRCACTQPASRPAYDAGRLIHPSTATSIPPPPPPREDILHGRAVAFVPFRASTTPPLPRIHSKSNRVARPPARLGATSASFVVIRTRGMEREARPSHPTTWRGLGDRWLDGSFLHPHQRIKRERRVQFELYLAAQNCTHR